MAKANRKANVEGKFDFSQHHTLVLISLSKTFTKEWKAKLNHLQELTDTINAIRTELKQRGVEV